MRGMNFGEKTYEKRDRTEVEFAPNPTESAFYNNPEFEDFKRNALNEVGDATEVESLSSVFREADGSENDRWCALGSVKSQMGHTKAAAGIAGVMKAALALKHKVLPPTLKVTEPLDVLKNGSSPFYVNTEKRPWPGSVDHPRRAAVSGSGFGGSNFHCVLGQSY